VPKKLGETKGPLIVWLFITSYLTLLTVVIAPLMGQLPESVPMSFALNLLIDQLRTWGVIIVFLVVFVAFWEKQRSLKGIFSSMGLKRKGFVQSMLWSLALFPLYFGISLITVVLLNILSPTLSGVAISQSRYPPWYVYYMIASSFFPVAVIEEMFARGYMLDRLMPEHPSSLAKASATIIISSLLFTSYHLPAYVNMYWTALPRAAALLIGNVFLWSLALSVAYVRARTRNIAGCVLIHFLADAIPFIIVLVTTT